MFILFTIYKILSDPPPHTFFFFFLMTVTCCSDKILSLFFWRTSPALYTQLCSFEFLKFFIYLALLLLSCCMQDLYLQHADS